MFLFLDLEMNTWKELTGELNSEIIEIGAVLMDDELRIIDSFGELVRPTYQTKLSPYCLHLTGIDKKKLFRALELKDVLVDLDNWTDGYKDIEKVYSWNESDYRQVVKECSVKNIETAFVLLLERSYADYQKIFGNEFDWQTCGLSDAMKVFNIAHSGKAHRALNDAMDLARLYKKMTKTCKDTRRLNFIKEQAELRKIQRLNPVLKHINKMRLGKKPSDELENKIKVAVLEDFQADITKVLRKYKVKEVIRACPELKDWLMVLEGMLVEMSEPTEEETAASLFRNQQAVNQ
ncbi:MAG: exonuclease domain-containing protein [Firmicutes bacterium]|nr:exonuclease domain-containing protein [Bacillota bacterium]MDD4694667.1 exonuclease domain-containing protein [Bacillota bacterium]